MAPTTTPYSESLELVPTGFFLQQNVYGDFVNDSDESDVQVVSTAKYRLDSFLAKDDDVVVMSRKPLLNFKREKNRQFLPMEEDEVIVVSKKAIIDWKNHPPMKSKKVQATEISSTVPLRRDEEEIITEGFTRTSYPPHVFLEEDHAADMNIKSKSNDNLIIACRNDEEVDIQQALVTDVSHGTTVGEEIFVREDVEDKLRNPSLDSLPLLCLQEQNQMVDWKENNPMDLRKDDVNDLAIKSQLGCEKGLVDLKGTDALAVLNNNVNDVSTKPSLDVKSMPLFWNDQAKIDTQLTYAEDKEGQQVQETDYSRLMEAMGSEITLSDDTEEYSQQLQDVVKFGERRESEQVPTTEISISSGTTTAVSPLGVISSVLTEKPSRASMHNLVLPDEEDILVVYRKPLIYLGKTKSREMPVSDQYPNPVVTTHAVAFASILLLLVASVAHLIFQKRKLYQENKGKPIAMKDEMPSSAKVATSDTHNKKIDMAPTDQVSNSTPGNESSLDHIHKIKIHSAKSESDMKSKRPIPELMSTQRNKSSSCLSSQQFDQDASTSTVLTSTLQVDENYDSVKETAIRLVNDIRLVQEVFRENGLDDSLASQVAMRIHSFREAKEVQQEIQLQKLALETQRELLAHQMETSICYDPNWKDKLKDRRDQCWNAACRLIWEVAIGHLLVNAAKPVIPLFFSDGQYSSWSSTTRLLQLMFTNVSIGSTRSAYTYDSSLTNHLSADQICHCDLLPRNLESTTRVASFFYGTWSNDMFWQLWGWDSSILLGQGTCYGYCLVSLGSISMIAFVAHQLLRAFSAPTLLHHATNALAISMLYGGPAPMNWMRHTRPELLALASTSLLGMLAVVEWNYRFHHEALTNCFTTNFRTTWDQSIEAMDTLKFRISFTKCIALAIMGSIVWLQPTDDKGGSCIVDSGHFNRGP